MKITTFVLGMAALGFSALGLSACNARVEANIQSSGSADFSVNASVIDALKTVFAGALDVGEINKTLAALPAVDSAVFKAGKAGSVNGKGQLGSVSGFLAPPASASPAQVEAMRCISYTKGSKAGTSRLAIKLNRTTSPLLVSLLSKKSQSYLSMLAPPVLMGTTLSEKDYLAQLKVFGYSQAMLDQLKAAVITVTLSFPRKVSGIKGGTAKGKTALFTLPVLDLMLLEKPIEWDVQW
jgi:hypothetical protein